MEKVVLNEYDEVVGGSCDRALKKNKAQDLDQLKNEYIFKMY